MADSTPYGAWQSPLSAADVAADATEFGGVAVDDGAVYWLERRPEEDGRGAVMCDPPDGEAGPVTPTEFDVRTTVHEYGGGDFVVHDGTVVFSRFDDQRLYRTDGETEATTATAITPESPEPSSRRYADVTVAPDGDRLYCVRERHDDGGGNLNGEDDADDGGNGDDGTDDAGPTNELVRVPLDGSEPPAVVAAGRDFYSFPRLDPAGERLAWTTWDHPQMPWDGTELHVADVAADGSLTDERVVAGGPEESVFQPTWGPEGTLYAVSDRTGWWNVYRDVATDPTLVREEAAEYGVAQWVFGLGTYAPLASGDLVAVRNADGVHDVGRLDPETGAFDPDAVGVEVDAVPYARLATDGETVATVAAGPTTPPTVLRWEAGEEATAVRRSTEVDLDPTAISEPTHLSFPTGPDGQETAHALYYPPRNPAVEAPEGPPPLVVSVHGGPTSQVLPVFDPSVQFFTTRGVGVVDVNYRGSTGYGRAYRDRLDGAWGEVDVADCVAAAEHLVDAGEADPDRLAIHGGSAGGYATLRALTARDAFDAGASYYGVADLRHLAEHTHEFESRYLDGLVGPLPEAADTYEARSPVSDADDIDAPLLVLQGGEDRVVPEAQAEEMVDALVETGTPYAYLSFPTERHGFRSAEATETALTAELGFYAAVFDFEPTGEPTALSLTRETYRKRTVDAAADESEANGANGENGANGAGWTNDENGANGANGAD
ncbi:MAG: prolyl oligopeptidase family serine peptidase [Halolamina sp.]